MSGLFLILVGTGILLVPVAVLPALKIFLRHRQRFDMCAGRFFELAPGLVANSAVTDRQADVLNYLGKHIDNPHVIFPLIRSIVDGKAKRGVKSGEQRSFDREVDLLPSDVRTDLQMAFTAGLLAISYTAPVRGWLLRTIWFTPVGMPERTTDAPHFAYRCFARC